MKRRKEKDKMNEAEKKGKEKNETLQEKKENIWKSLDSEGGEKENYRIKLRKRKKKKKK